MNNDDHPTVLIIDDDQGICRSMKLILERKGYDVETAYTGTDGLRKGSNAAVVFLDIRLPDMDGTEVLEKLLDENPDVEVVMVTGNANVENTVDALNKGAAAYLLKPLDMDKVLNKLAFLIDRQRTRRKQGQSAEAAEELSSITDSAPDALVRLDSEGIVRFWNPAAEHLFGYPSEDMIGSHIVKVIPEYRKIEDKIDSFTGNDSESSSERLMTTDLRGIARNGKTLALSISVGRASMEAKEQIMLVIRNMTELERETEDLRTKEAELRLHSRIIRHDLKNDIQTLMLYLEGIQMLIAGDSTELVEMVSSAIKVSERMESILEELSLKTDFKEMDILEYINQVANEAESSYRGLIVGVESDLDTTEFEVPMTGLLNIVFSNLIRNTVDHAGENAEIGIRLEEYDGALRIFFRDDGPGIADEVKDKLFRKGVSTKGSGVGLYICREIMNSMNGSIQLCDKEPSQGACFELVIPINK